MAGKRKSPKQTRDRIPYYLALATAIIGPVAEIIDLIRRLLEQPSEGDIPPQRL